MTVQTIPVGELQTNCYLLWDESGIAAVIDPGDEAAEILAAVAAHRLRVAAVLLTHLHIDHFGAAPAVLAATGAQLLLPQAEEPALTDDLRSLMVWLPREGRFTLTPDRLLRDGDTVAIGDITLSVMATPGHTAGSCCFDSGDTLFCGDTLFAGSAGRCDLPSGDGTALRNSLRRLAALSGDRRVLPGHGGETTLSHERVDNPFMK